MALTGQSISSDVELCFATRSVADNHAQTYLKKRKTGGLVHLGKPYYYDDVLLTQVINPTAGFFAGDQLRFHVTLEKGAKVLLNQPGATRFHTMNQGDQAKITQRFSVGSEASLDLYPDFSISQRGSSLVQRTELHLAESAKCCFLEILTPGRIAHGDQMEWNMLQNDLDIFCDGRLLARERMSLREPENWRMRDQNGSPLYIASFWLQHPTLDAIEKLELIQGTHDTHIGWALLADNFGVIRVATPSSVLLRKTVDQLRLELAKIDSDFGRSNALY